MDNQKPDFAASAYLMPRIHPEGRKFGAIASAAAIGDLVLAAALVGFSPMTASVLGALFVPMALLAYGVFLFFRDPERFPPEDDPKAVLSPADGKVSMIVQVPLPPEIAPERPAGADAALDPLYTRVSVFMSVFNVHVNRMPTAGTIVKKAYVPGEFLNASLDKAPEVNERCCYLVETTDGAQYGVVQIAGLVAKRIVPFVEEGATLAQAERFGLIRFGSRLDVYLPPGVRSEVRVGQIMVAGETILGHLS
jgi:phosphatidylserine decarboxylase